MQENTQNIVSATENIDFNVLNWDWNNMSDKIFTYGLQTIGAILIMIVGFWLAERLSKIIIIGLRRPNISISMLNFIKSLISIIFKILVLLVALSTVGFEVTAFVALLGGLAVGVGMALQGSLSNLAGGILILLFKPFKIGDYIQSLDKKGTVTEISVLQTVLLTPDMRTVILPNGNVFNNPIENYSKHGMRRVEIKIGIGYDDDFDKAKEILLEVFKNEPLILDEKDYVVEIDEFGDSSVNLAMYGYARAENYLKAKWKLNRSAKKALDENGFSIPFPQRDLHLVTVDNKKAQFKINQENN